ncbi:unnamed protein product [Pipistrellus nathusii]|uniref:Uncharacterized protein n=1 Tax=Pipistrellus nathusii TaxID=59473 RepID=A0ABP0A1X7_PIPNA
MRKQKRALLFIQVKAEGQIAFLCGPIIFTPTIQLYIHTSQPARWKIEIITFLPIIPTPLSCTYAYPAERSYYHVKRGTLYSQVTQTHTEEKTSSLWTVPLFS